MPIIDQPTYPVVDKTPSFGGVVGNFSLRDYGTWGGLTAACLPVGYWLGYKTPLMAKQSAIMAAMVGGLGGFMLAYQASAGRLMGFLPNDREVDKYLSE